MSLFLIVAVGLCLGVVSAQARVPRIRWVPLASVLILAAVAVVLFIMTPSPAPLLAGLLFTASTLLSSTLYAGVLWRRLGRDPEVSYWAWVVRDLSHPRYLRQSHAAHLATRG